MGYNSTLQSGERAINNIISRNPKPEIFEK